MPYFHIGPDNVILGGHPVHRRMWSSILGLSLLVSVASPPPPNPDWKQKCPQTAPGDAGGKVSTRISEEEVSVPRPFLSRQWMYFFFLASATWRCFCFCNHIWGKRWELIFLKSFLPFCKERKWIPFMNKRQASGSPCSVQKICVHSIHGVDHADTANCPLWH